MEIQIQSESLSLTLAPKEGLVLQTLASAYPNSITMREILTQVYGDDWPKSRTVDVYLCAVRKRLKSFGYRIHTKRGSYRLVKE